MPVVTVFGGSGFIGRYAVRKLAKQGWRVKVAVRRPNEAMFLRTAGDVGQVEMVQANIRDDASTRRAIDGADAVINLVGILFPTGKQTFDAVQRDGAARIARFCAELGVERLVHVSAIGADAESQVAYQRTKAEAEQAVLDAVPTATILRPSLVFGPEDEFFNRFAGMARMSPVLPLVGGDTRFQPVYVGDVAEAVVNALGSAEARGQTFELGGPEIVTMRKVFEIIMEETNRKRAVLPVPDWMARIQATVLELPNKLFGLPPLLTRDQVAMLAVDNVVPEGAKTLDDLGVKATTLDSILPTYLYRYRPSGQYAHMKVDR
jgi:NADH dehydrogenase